MTGGVVGEALVTDEPRRADGNPPAWRRARQGEGRRWLAQHSLPSPRDEVWRDSPVRSILAAVDAGLAVDHASDPAPLPSGGEHDIAIGGLECLRIVLVNGAFEASLSSLPPTEGIDVRSLADRDRCSTLLKRIEGVARPSGMLALGWVEADDGALVHVRRGADRRPIHILHLAVPGAAPLVSHPVTEIRIDDGADVAIIETFMGSGPSTVVNASTMIRVGDGASLDHHRVQSDSPQGIHLGEVRMTVGQGSQAQIHAFTLGAAIARTSIDVTLAGAGSTVALDALALPGPGQSHNTVVTVDHAADRGTSTQQVRNVISDGGRGSFTGRIIVAPGTVGTVADQTNRNLLLGPTAHAASQPWLEILADDVACSHGATVGRLDDEALFYLRSRGISAERARQMLIDAFIGNLLDPVEPEALRTHLVALVAAQRGRSETPR